jgi:hypothetical protein
MKPGPLSKFSKLGDARKLGKGYCGGSRGAHRIRRTVTGQTSLVSSLSMPAQLVFRGCPLSMTFGNPAAIFGSTLGAAAWLMACKVAQHTRHHRE